MPPVRLRSRRSGFTLVELLAVIAVISVLVTLSFPLIRGAKLRAAAARTRGELAVLAQALERYKAYYGDYPQTGAAPSASTESDSGLTAAHAQSLLFNALAGVYGPGDFVQLLNGPLCFESTAVRTEFPLRETVFGVPQGSPPVKVPMTNAFVDGWGNRYMYYYKAAAPPEKTVASPWRLPGYLLYSVGMDGEHFPPDPTTGLYPDVSAGAGVNADNVYASP